MSSEPPPPPSVLPLPPPLPIGVMPYATPAGPMGELQCPRCAQWSASKAVFTWWGGLLGPKLFSHAKCKACGCQFNYKTGKSNSTKIIIYLVVGGVVGIVLGGVILVMAWSLLNR